MPKLHSRDNDDSEYVALFVEVNRK